MRTPTLLCLFALLAACDGGDPVETGELDDTGVDDTDTSDTSDTSDTDGPPPTALGALVHPLNPVLKVNASTKLRARTAMSDHSLGPAPASGQWSSSDPSIATIDANGTVTALSEGMAWIHHNSGGERISSPLKVVAADDLLDSMEVWPQSATIPLGGSQIFSAKVRSSTVPAGDIAPDCTWTSSDPSVALAGAAGVITGVAEGFVTISVDCPTVGLIGATGSAGLFVEPQPQEPSNLAVSDLTTTPFPLGIVDWTVGVKNTGGQSLPFTIDLFTDATSAPSAGPGDITLRAPGLAMNASLDLHVATTFSGARPATVQPWVLVDAAGQTLDLDPSDNLAWPSTIELPEDLTADIAVEGVLGITFGPGSSGISLTLTNNGPNTVTDITVWLDADKPGVTSVYDLDSATAEQSVVIESLTSGESFEVAIDHYDAPFGTTWNTCAWVLMDGVVDPDLSNNFACDEWTE